MDDLSKIEDVLKDKQIIRIDRNKNKTELELIVIFVNPEKKQMGHFISKIPYNKPKDIKRFKEILDHKFNISIKGYKNWKKKIKEY